MQDATFNYGDAVGGEMQFAINFIVYATHDPIKNESSHLIFHHLLQRPYTIPTK